MDDDVDTMLKQQSNKQTKLAQKVIDYSTYIPFILQMYFFIYFIFLGAEEKIFTQQKDQQSGACERGTQRE